MCTFCSVFIIYIFSCCLPRHVGMFAVWLSKQHLYIYNIDVCYLQNIIVGRDYSLINGLIPEMKNMNIPGRYDYFLNYAIFLENMDYFLSIWKFFFQNYWQFSENLYYSLKMWTTPLYWTITWKMDYSLKYGLLYTELYTKIDYSLKIWIILWKCRLSPDNVNFSFNLNNV